MGALRLARSKDNDDGEIADAHRAMVFLSNREAKTARWFEELTRLVPTP